MRKIINDPQTFVDETLEGILLAHPDELRAVTADRRALARTDAPAPGRVGIVTGGGSGHLPFFLGYVGRGLCSAVAVGNVFSSPSSAQIHAASVAVHSDAGLLYLYGNYGGDVLNFDIAAERCRAEGIEVRTVLGADDIQSAPSERAESRRGVAGLVLVYKVAGAMADRGASLAEVERVTRKAADSTRTMGVGLSPTVLPAAGEETFTLDEGEMEIGVGIHGERGSHRGPLETADAITDRFLVEIGTELDLSEGRRVAVLVNGLGSTPLEELYVIYRRVHHTLADAGVTIGYRLIGEYVTSLEMAGASLSIMQLDDELEELLHDPAGSPFFRQGTVPVGEAFTAGAAVDEDAVAVEATVVGSRSDLRDLLLTVLRRMERHREELRALDAALGDGDLGVTVAVGSAAVADMLQQLPDDLDARSVLRASGDAFAAANPSTFAALIGNGLLAAAEQTPVGAHLDRAGLIDVVRTAAAKIGAQGGAVPGDKTVIDVLLPIAEALEAGADAGAASKAALAAVTESTGWQSRRGRAGWQQERSVGHADPGSVAVARFVEEIVRAQDGTGQTGA
ncbi:dihydroxyacetone kinase family protein [Microbacterium sp. Ag1]|uniref:dihydroxyacetone kinase family protein n=1 Tax=Microbacterium sp. Ag1 TaxID=1643443 RepID=UPI000629002B|nr:dihydroxyacetone kinase family protein [Microbacterium sp. Ag1]KKX99331.1 dihydroxyacetone kinase [Microbacterium sp. Ag1]